MEEIKGKQDKTDLKKKLRTRLKTIRAVMNRDKEEEEEEEVLSQKLSEGNDDNPLLLGD